MVSTPIRSGQLKPNDTIAGSECITPSYRNHNKLLPRIELIAHRCSPPACRKGSRPEQLSGFNIVGMKLVIQRCSDKDEPSAGDDRPAQIDGAPVIGNLILFARTGKPAHRSQRYIPKNRT